MLDSNIYEPVMCELCRIWISFI